MATNAAANFQPSPFAAAPTRCMGPESPKNAANAAAATAAEPTQNATLSEPVARSTARRSAPNSNAGVASETVAV